MPDDTSIEAVRTSFGSTSTSPTRSATGRSDLGCTEQELRDAVAAAGVLAEDVRAALGERMMIEARHRSCSPLWAGWAPWQRAHGRSPENPVDERARSLPARIPGIA